MASPEPQGPAQASGGVPEQANRNTLAPAQQSPQTSRRMAEAPPMTDPSAQTQTRGATRSRAASASTSAPRSKESSSNENTPRADSQRHTRGGSQGTPPRARHASVESRASTTPRAPPGGRSPATPSTVRTTYQPTGSSPSQKGTPQLDNATPFSMSAAATLVSEQARYSPGLRRSPPARLSPSQESSHTRQQR